MMTAAFWRDLAERTISTAAQSALLALGGAQLDLFHADWKVIGGAAASGAAMTLLKGLAASFVGEQTPSFASLHYEARHKA